MHDRTQSRRPPQPVYLPARRGAVHKLVWSPPGPVGLPAAARTCVTRLRLTCHASHPLQVATYNR